MDRRQFLLTGWLPALVCGGLALSGCADETKQTGTVVPTPPEDLKSMEASSAAYKAMSKESKK